jgi:hypothetical protein
MSGPYFILTDGVTTVTFGDGNSGAVAFAPVTDSWAPGLPTFRRSPLGRSRYNPVVGDLHHQHP